MRNRMLSVRLLGALALFALGAMLSGGGEKDWTAAAFIPGVVLTALSKKYPSCIGSGDALFILAAGGYLSVHHLLLWIWIAAAAASAVGLGRIFRQKSCGVQESWRKATLPFIPFLGLSWLLILLGEGMKTAG